MSDCPCCGAPELKIHVTIDGRPASFGWKPCTCSGPPAQPCGPNCRYPYTDEKERPLCQD